MTDKFAIWSFVSENSGEVLVHGMIFRTEPNMTRYSVKLRGLISDKKYVVDGDNTIYTGKALMEGGILLPKPWEISSRLNCISKKYNYTERRIQYETTSFY